MKISLSKCKKEKNIGSNLILKWSIVAVFALASINNVSAQGAEISTVKNKSNQKARVTGLRYICVHVLELEKTLKLYREILGFKLSKSEILGGGLEGMLVLKLRADDFEISLSIPPPEAMDSYKPIGNTNHNHFMLIVNDIGPIGDKLKAEGYQLENENYRQDKYTFFKGPNGEIIGLSSWDD
ncbi:VOC family protein [Aquimarina agarilytica]|uniref:VOC family protein n=1 Tax=Aquimarina agarilytica TaxID=1087449 RepID=UPI0002883479|nr:VOC family protein [Aquimarina agarilytica]